MDSNYDNTNINITSTKSSSRKTVWDPTTHMIFVELCLDEVRNGNRPGSHFNKVGWTNLEKNLKDRTGKVYSKIQLKNHWDSMKKDWKLYDRLMRIESGLGWDSVRKTIDATPEWWDEKIQADPELAKFRDKNLEMYHMYYGPLFQDSVAIGDRTKTPSQFQNDNNPNNVQDEIGVVDIEGKGDSDEMSGDDVEITFPESSSSSKKRKKKNNAHNRSNKGKNMAASSFEVKLDTVLQALSSRSTQTSTPPKSVPSIAECMDIVSTFPGFEPSSSSYNKALQIFWKKEARESFMYPPTTIDKMNFLYSLMNE